MIACLFADEAISARRDYVPGGCLQKRKAAAPVKITSNRHYVESGDRRRRQSSA
jgi:hypothetical protein